MHIPLSRTLGSTPTMLKAYVTTKYSNWTFSPERLKMYAYETPNWKKYYLPKKRIKYPLENGSLIAYKNILDIGAGEGETAKFFIDNHAIKVTAIEPDTNAFTNLKKNSQKNSNLIAIQDVFRLSQIEEAYPLIDLIKIDIEGYEEELLQLPTPKTPIVCEVHGLQLADKFKQAGYHVITPSQSKCLSYAYWKCMP